LEQQLQRTFRITLRIWAALQDIGQIGKGSTRSGNYGFNADDF